MPLSPLCHLLLDSLFCLSNGLLHPRLDMMHKCGHLVLYFWTLAIGTSAVDRVEGEEIGAMLVPGIDSIGVVFVGSDVA